MFLVEDEKLLKKLQSDPVSSENTSGSKKILTLRKSPHIFTVKHPRKDSTAFVRQQ